jgi:hypothetical protein
MKCRNCGEPIRRIRPGDGYDQREYTWTHESGGILCDLPPLSAEPDEVTR